MKQISVLLCIFLWPAWHIVGIFVASDLTAHMQCTQLVAMFGVPANLFQECAGKRVCKQNTWVTFSSSQRVLYSPLLKTRPNPADLLFALFPWAHTSYLLEPSIVTCGSSKLGNSFVKGSCQTMQTRVDYGQERLFGTQSSSEYFYLPWELVVFWPLTPKVIPLTEGCDRSYSSFPIKSCYTSPEPIYFWETVPLFLGYGKRKELNLGMKG